MRNTFLIIAVLLSITIYSQEDKTVTLTVSGTGKTLEEAKTNALRSAIEQAFGAFISSNTEILNDNLVKDEIVSISNGNIQKFDIISQVEIPNNGFAITLSTTVSISKLTTFAESKGVVVEFKGGMFGANIKLQKLNEESEYVAIKNILVQTLTILESSYNYSLKVNEPKLIEGDMYSILLEVSSNSNESYNNLWDFFRKSIRQISLNEIDALSIENLGKKIFFLEVDGGTIYKLRNLKSLNALYNFCMFSSIMSSNSFIIKNNIETIKIDDEVAVLFMSFIGDYDNRNGFFRNEQLIYSKPNEIYINDGTKENNLLDYIKINKIEIGNLLNLKLNKNQNNKIDYNSLKIKTNASLYNPRENKILKYIVNIKLSDLEKINTFEIERKNFLELLKSFNSFRIIKKI